MTTEPTQPLADEELAQIRNYLDGSDAYGPRSVGNHNMLRRLLAEVDRLRAENTAQAERLAMFVEPHKLVARNIAWFGEDGVLHVTEHTVCDHCVPKFAQFNRREDIPEGPCKIGRALGLDQDGRGQANE